LLKLNCDATTVAAAMLSQVLSAKSPTWPRSRLPPPFCAEVSSLLDQQRRMRALGASSADLDDDQADAVRTVLRRGLAAEAGAKRAVQQRAAERGIHAPDEATVIIDADTGVDVGSTAALGQRVQALAAASSGMGFAEFLSAARSVGTGYSEESLRELFDVCDADSSGAIDKGEARLLLTKLRDQPGPEKQQPEGPPQQQMDPRAMVVLLGGALVGLRTSPALPCAERQARALEAVQLFAPLAHSVGLGGGAFSELESLSYASLFPESLRRLRGWYKQTWPDAEVVVPHLCATLEEQLLRAPSLAGLIGSIKVSGRVKSVTSTFRKLLRDNVGSNAGDNVRDALALRVILLPSDDAPAQLGSLMQRVAPLGVEETEALVCFGVYKQTLRLWQEVPGRFKDFVTNPKPNGYQSLHTNVRLDDGRVVEVQIRTAAMHQRAEHGSASHNAYRAAQLGATSSMSEVPLLPPSESKLLPPASGQADFGDWAADASASELPRVPILIGAAEMEAVELVLDSGGSRAPRAAAHWTGARSK